VFSGYAGFNYNFGFDGSATGDASGGGITSPINFGNWSNLGSPMATGSNDQFSAFLQQTNSGDNGVDTSFSFASFNYVGMFLILISFSIELSFSLPSILDITGGVGEASTDGAFGSFFFGTGGSPINKEQAHDGKSN
jgi:hypothetical protein